MPTLQQIRQNAFVPYGTAGFGSNMPNYFGNLNSLGQGTPGAGQLPAYTDGLHPPGASQGWNNPTVYAPGGYPSSGVNNINAVPGAGAPGPNAGWTGRLPGYLAGGQVGLGVGAINEAIRAFRGNRGFPSNNMRGANDRPAGGSGGLSSLFSGAPLNQANWTNYNAPYQHGAPFQGSNAFDRSGSNYYSDRQSNLAQSAEDLSLMASQANGGAANNTGTTQDEGHTIFGSQSRTHGLMSDGIVEIQPGGIYDTVFAHGMGANNPNRFRGAASLYQNPPASVGQAAPPLIAPTGPQPIGSGQPGPFVGPLQMPGPMPIGNGQPFQGPIQYPRRQPPYSQPPGFYGGPIRGK